MLVLVSALHSFTFHCFDWFASGREEPHCRGVARATHKCGIGVHDVLSLLDETSHELQYWAPRDVA